MNFLTSAITDVGISKQTNQDSLLLKSAKHLFNNSTENSQLKFSLTFSHLLINLSNFYQKT